MANGRCRFHGGMIPTGPALPQYKTGRYSKVLPPRLRERYEEAAQDSELLVLREEIALLDARIIDLIARVESGEAGAIWGQANEHYLAARAAIRSGDAVELGNALDALGVTIRRGQADYAAWDEIKETLDLRRKLVESERKRLVQLSQMITTEQAMVLMTAIVALVQENVTDRQALAKISDGIRRLTVVDGRLAGA
jgi:hypothetical protein